MLEKLFKANRVDFIVDYKFWALTPAVNLNFHTFELEFEWLCFGLYIRKFPPII